MKHVDIARFSDILFKDINPVINYAHNVNDKKHFTGNIRMHLGLYRTPEESAHYVNASLQRKLP